MMEEEVSKRLRDAEERLRMAMLHSDVAALDELLAPGLVFTSHLGQVVGKDDDLAFHRSGVLRLRQLEASEQRIAVHGDVAVVCVRMQLVGELCGQPLNETLRYTRIWSLGPIMQVIAGHASLVAKAIETTGVFHS